MARGKKRAKGIDPFHIEITEQDIIDAMKEAGKPPELIAKLERMRTQKK